MTGTPVSESPMNAYVALRTLSMDIIPHIQKFQNHFELRKNINVPRKNPKTQKVEYITVNKAVGHKNLEELRGLLDSISIRRTKDDMTGFPDRVLMVRDVEMKGKQLALYKTICGELVADISDQERIDLDKFLSDDLKTLRLRQVMNHPSLLDEGGDSAKYIECDAILEEILADPEAKVVIWTEYRRSVELLQERYNKKYGAVKIYGGVNNKQLEKIAHEFENADTPRVAVCIPAKAGTGVDFLARARTAIYIDRPYSFTLYKQSLERIHRRVVQEGEHQSDLDRIRSKPATMIFIDVVQSIDELIRNQLLEKERMATALTTSTEKLVEMGREDILRYLMR
jgi:SNF2 family DNA or RNA helicase